MISDIRLQHFRSYSDDVFEFAPGVNIIVGANASGKTNLLESVLVVARGSSYRVRDAELIEHGQPWARLDARLYGRADGSVSAAQAAQDVRTVKVVAEPVLSKTYEIGGKTYRRLPPAKRLPAVVFEPDHLYMLSGSPELRRSYLDDLLEQIEPGYGTLRRDYRRTLTQRNALLKRLGMAAAPQMFPWNVRMSELGGAIAEARLRLLSDMNERSSGLYGSLADNATDVRLEYETKLAHGHYASSLLHKLETSFELDVARGFTGSGPHREDMRVLINGHPTQLTASRGETRTAVLMLKIIELELVEQAYQSAGVRPLLLLDDVFSELDGRRRQALTGFVRDYQTFITTTDADVVVQHFIGQCAIIPTSR